MKMILLVSTLFSFSFVQSAEKTMLPSKDVLKSAQIHNKMQTSLKSTGGPSLYITHSYVEYMPAKYLLFSSQDNFNSGQIKEGLLRELPQGTDVVIFFKIPESIDKIRESAEAILEDPSRLHLLPVDSSDGFWARDALPVPVYSEEKLVLIDAKYYHGFKRDQKFSDYLNVDLLSHDYFFEGGNFIPDAKGNCLLVRKGTGSTMAEYILRDYYGCKNSIFLPFNSGIGHVDERIKIVSNEVALTDTKAYRLVLEKLGYEVRMLPRPRTLMGTYANSLLVNGTIFLPTYGEDSDDEAIAIYEELGFKVVPLRSNDLSSNGAGSIHCITMTYPEEFGANLYLGLF